MFPAKNIAGLKASEFGTQILQILQIKDKNHFTAGA